MGKNVTQFKDKNGTVYDVKDTNAREDISELKSEVTQIAMETTEDVVTVDTTGETIKTWTGLSKNLVVQKGYIEGKSGKVKLSFYNTSTHSSWDTVPFIFVLLYESNGKLIVVDNVSVDTPSSTGLFDVDTSWELDSSKKYYIGVWRNGSGYVPFIESALYGTYTVSVWDDVSDITAGAEISISSMSNVTWNTIVMNLEVLSDITDEINTLNGKTSAIENNVDDLSEDVGDISLLTSPAGSIVEAINNLNGEDRKITDFSMTSPSTWAGMSKGIFILDAPIIKQSGKVELSCYNTSTHSSWASIPFWFILYERTSAGIFKVVSKMSVNTPSSVGKFSFETGWTVTDDKVYYIGMWRAGGTYAAYIDGGVSTFYKSEAYDSDSDFAVGTTISYSSLSVASSNSVLINITVSPDGKHAEKNISKARMVHFSVDDCVFWSDLIDNENNYSSCFENEQLAWWKKLHDVYGICVTLNCFCSDGTNSIEDVPDKFASEFAENAYWLKFAFHAEDSSTYYDTDKVDAITTSYNTFVTAIIKMTGTADAIDPVTRLGFYSGTIANVQAIRDAKCGITGLLTSDDTRVSYYLNTDQNNFILGHNYFLDADNHLMLIHTMPRIENVSSTIDALDSYTGKDWENQNGILEFFIHEYAMSSSRIVQIGNYCVWALIIGAEFGFASNCLLIHGGGSGGIPGKDGEAVSDYTSLSNKPSINSVTLSGNKSLTDIGAQAVANLVTSLSGSSTNTQYPSAKCVYDMIGDVETLLSGI